MLPVQLRLLHGAIANRRHGKKQRRTGAAAPILLSGAGGNRTHDPLLANVPTWLK